MAIIEPDYLEKLKARIHELEGEMATPDIATNPKRMRERIRKHKHAKNLLNIGSTYLDLLQQREETQGMLDDDALDDDMREMAEMEFADLEDKSAASEKRLKLALLDPDPDDERNAILEIRAGTGGDEAALFAGDLFRMYTRYAEQRGWTLKLIEENASGVGGYKEVIASVQGDDVFKWLKYESGVHRVQRVPVTEASGRIHTSAATVAVLPEAEKIDEIDIPAEDLRVDVFRSSGPGGQSVNTTDSAIRLTHLPTGLVVQCQDEKSQHRNREKALLVLQARLLDQQRWETEAKRAGDRKSMIGTGDRSERIRTYNFPQNRLTDHRINLSLYSLESVMEGEIDPLVEALLAHDVDKQLAEKLDA